jgi:alpha-tubulin suppressor-like RCC1 family protein
VWSLPILLGVLCAPARGENLDAQSVAAGAFHFCAIVGGGAQCWGDNFDGQLGDGSFLDKVTPVPDAGLQSGVTAIAGGSYHTCAIVNGGVKCWGFNGDGELGNGSLASSGVPVAVQGLASGVIAIAAGAYHTCAVISGGAVRCWGWNSDGQLGNNTTNATNTNPPVSVIGIASGATALAGGDAHTCALVSGNVKCWGNNAWGQLDDGSLTTRYAPVGAAGLTGIVAISAGRAHNCAIQNDGGVRCWGRNDHGQLGNGSYVPTGTNLPVTPTGLASAATSIAAGGSFTCTVISGAAKCWGSNYYGELGDGTLSERQVPAAVSGLGSGVGAIVAARFSACAQLPASHLTQCWGDNIDGEVAQGSGDLVVRAVPVTVTSLASGATALAGNSQGEHSCAIVGGAARCWGDNDYGELGDGTFVPRPTPVTVTGLTSGVSAIGIGNIHTCAVVNGAAKCWGSNDHGQLGIGSSGGLSTTPVTPIASGVSAIAAGAWHTCAIVGTGVKCWGYNGDGQLGNGSTAQSNTPATVGGLVATPVALSAGAWHTCAVLANGKVQCWGYNSNGQLGNNSTVATGAGAPVVVSNIASGATAIAAGAYHSCAIVSAGARCWGYGQDGELGNNQLADSHVPVAVSGLAASVTSIAAGSWHSCAIANGAVSCWGASFSGQLGNGDRELRQTPVPVSGLAANATALTAGDFHSCAIVGGAVKCWGGNYFGQLGDGRKVYFTAPQTAVASDSPDSTCGPTLVSLGAQPSTQAENQPVLFSISIGNVVSPYGSVSVFAGGALVCTATLAGDPQASCWGYLLLGTHALAAKYSGGGTTPSGCSAPTNVTISSASGVTGTTLDLAIVAPDGLAQGASLTIDATPIKPLILGPDGGVDPASTAVTSFSGFVTFYDGTIEVGSVSMSGGKASFTNAFVGGTHQFSARYSGDGVNAMSTATDAVQVTKPADDVFYSGFELPPG